MNESSCQQDLVTRARHRGETMTRVESTTSLLDRTGLTAEQHAKLVQMLDAKSGQPTAADKRRSIRYPYVLPGGLMLRVRHPGGSWGVDQVRSRNISAHGIGFFYTGYLHQQTYCIFGLPTRHGTIIVRDGRVVHCRHILGRVHEIGVQFNVTLDVKPFIDVPRSTSDVANARFSGRVLVAEEASTDRAALCTEATALGAAVAEAGDAAAMLKLASQLPFDLIILSGSLSGRKAGELIAMLRSSGCRSPIACWAASTCVAGTDALEKPLNRQQLAGLFAKHLASGGHDQDEMTIIESELWRMPAMRPLLLSFLEKLEERLVTLEELIDQAGSPPRAAGNRRRQAKISEIVDEIYQSAGIHGYPGIAAAAGGLADESPDGGHDRLLSLCRAACNFRATIEYADAANWIADPACHLFVPPRSSRA